jgi:hypothetical protein
LHSRERVICKALEALPYDGKIAQVPQSAGGGGARLAIRRIGEFKDHCVSCRFTEVAETEQVVDVIVLILCCCEAAEKPAALLCDISYPTGRGVTGAFQEWGLVWSEK